ncbi:TIR domain-containing protein [Chromobacterium amazonense]|uniref:TIR domain-containing protein n=1 Tax=Chromobacterium amazonense TaxID=1382803 RepID=UPI0009F19A38|nr:nucleotide-binding protein [Chromobacterium amazonense]
MYYHVIAETTEKTKGEYELFYEFDCTDLEEIKELVVHPYQKEGKIYIDGSHIEFKKIRSLKIKSSEKTLDELCSIAQSKLSPNIFYFYTKADILKSDSYVEDITKKILLSSGSILKANDHEPHSLVEEKNKVFIVHGRDNHAKTDIARFIERLGFDAIILHEQASSGKTIIEKIEEYTNVSFAIVLYTPCDTGGLAGEMENKPRARQNVVFEHGYLIGKIGRNKVCALVKGDIETPNDINGIVYIPLDSNGAWRMHVAREMREAGCVLDMNKVI